VAAPFAVGLVWPGARAIATGVPPPLMGPDIGSVLSGGRTPHDAEAVPAGGSRALPGGAFLLAVSTSTRCRQAHRPRQAVAWLLVVASVSFFAYVVRHVGHGPA